MIKSIFRALTSALSLLSFFLGLLHLMQVRSARGMALRTLKSMSEALSPFLMLIAGISALLSWLARSPLAALAGAAGALLQADYFRGVTQPHRAFEESFGSDWEERLARQMGPAPAQKMLQSRWRWPFPKDTQEPRWEQDAIYHTIPGINGSLDRELRCDLWQPPVGFSTSGVSVIYIHGGGYFTSSKDFGTRALFHHLANQGHVVMDIDYRLGPTADLFEMLDDVHHSIVWMKQNAEWFGADPDRVVLIGSSAGAHLALLAAYAPNHPRLVSLDLQEADTSVRAVVSYYGIIDMKETYQAIHNFMASAPHSRTLPENFLDQPLAEKFIQLSAWVRAVDPAAMRAYLTENQNLMYAGLSSSMSRLIGGTPDEIPDVYTLVSPLTHAGPGCPPTLLLQGEHDYLLPAKPPGSLYRKLREAGVPAVYLELPRTEHTFDLFLPELSPPAQSALYDLDRFLMLIR